MANNRLRLSHRPLLALTIAASVMAPQGQYARAEDTGSDFWTRDSLTGDWGGRRPALEDQGIKAGLQEQSETWANVTGGMRRGATYNGLTMATLNLDLDRLLGWTGTTFFASGYQIHGHGPSQNLAGNLNTVTNAEATRSTKLYGLWLEQTLLDDRLSLRAGQDGVSENFMASPYASLYLNASFGGPALPALNLPSGGPNYPLATPMVRVRYQIDENFSLGTGLFNGDPAGPGADDPQLRDRTGTQFRVNDGALSVTELTWSHNHGKDATGLAASYKVGGMYHSGHFTDQRYDNDGRSLADPASSGAARRRHGNHVLYAGFDQALYSTGSNGEEIGLFGLAMMAPGDRNQSDLFLRGGVNWRGMIDGRPDDTVGLAFAYLGIGDGIRQHYGDLQRFGSSANNVRASETVVELSYLYQLAPWWSLQPDVQYIMQPGAGIPSATNRFAPAALHDSLMLGLRTTIIF